MISARKKMKTYNRKPKQIKAIQYDGSEEMAEEIEDRSNGECCIEYDEGLTFNGFRAKTKWGKENYKSQYVQEGDYITFENDEWTLVEQQQLKEQKKEVTK